MINTKKNMKVIVVGVGSIGESIAAQLTKDGCEVTVIDRNSECLDRLANTVDAIGFQGNGAAYNTLSELNAKDTDVVIAVTDSDEINILSCFTAHAIGAKHTIARIREFDYVNQNHFYRDELGISMIINPDLASANEIFRTMRFPVATRIELFAGGRAELVEMAINEDSPLVGHSLMDIRQNMGINLLVCAIVRDGEAFVPKGYDVVQNKDIIYLTGEDVEFRNSFRKLNMPIKPLKSVMIAGNDRITTYLASLLVERGVSVTIVDNDRAVCEVMADKLPKASVMNEDALRYFDSMSDTDIRNTDAFIAITTNDEYNLIAAMYAESQGISKVIAKIGAKSRLKVMSDKSKICTLSREDVAADRILGYTRALLNAEDNEAVESLYRLLDGKLEFIEFRVDAKDVNVGAPLKSLKMKKGVLLAGIIRNAHMIIPTGNDYLQAEDIALVASVDHQIARLEDIYE